MLNHFFTHLCLQLSEFLVKHKSDLQNTVIEGSDLPGFLKSYLKTASDSAQADMKELLNFLQGQQNQMGETALSGYLADFFSGTLPLLLAKLPVNYVLLHKEDQDKLLNSLGLQSSLSAVLHDLLNENSMQEIVNSVRQSLNAWDVKYTNVMVQLPCDIDSELKLGILKQLSSQFERALIYFQIDNKLIGGLRIIADGKMYDYSWTRKIKNLIKLN